MAEQLGAYLVRKGLITQPQWEEAQKSQLIYGGSLGTNLVELGMLDLTALGQALSDAFYFPLVTEAELEAVTPETLALLKPDLARTHQAFPLALEGRRLRVAMVEPQDPRHVDALGFATGMRIVPSIITEPRLVQMLEKRYGIPRPPRPPRPGQGKPSMGMAAPGAAPRPAPAPKPAMPGVAAPLAGAVAKPAAPPPGSIPTAPGVLASSPGMAAPLRPAGAPGAPPPGTLPPRPAGAPGSPPSGPVPPWTAPATAKPAGAPPPGAAPGGPNLPPGMMQRSAPAMPPPGAAPGLAAPPSGVPRPPPPGAPGASPGMAAVRPPMPGSPPAPVGAPVSVGTIAVAKPPMGAPAAGPAPSSPGVARPFSPAPPPGASGVPAPLMAAPGTPGAGPVPAPRPASPPPGVAQPLTAAPRPAALPVSQTTTRSAMAPLPTHPTVQPPAPAPKPEPVPPPAAVAAPAPKPEPVVAAASEPPPPSPVNKPEAPRPPVAAATSLEVDFDNWDMSDEPPAAAKAEAAAPVPVSAPPPASKPEPGVTVASEPSPPSPSNPPETPRPPVAAAPAPAAPPAKAATEPDPEFDGWEMPDEPVAVAKAEAAAPVEVPTPPPAPLAPAPPPPAVVASAPSVPAPVAVEPEAAAKTMRGGDVHAMELSSEPVGEMEFSSTFDMGELSAETSSWTQRGIEVDFASQDASASDGMGDAQGGMQLASAFDFIPSWDPSAQAPEPEASAPVRQEDQRVQLPQALEALQRATTRGELGTALLSYVRGRFPRGFLLGETFGSARVGRAYGEGSDRPEVASLLVDLDSPSLLAVAAHQGGPVVSSVPESRMDEALFAALGESFSHLMAVPLRLRERAVGFVVVDGGPSPFGAEELEEMGRLLQGASEACGRLHQLS